MTQVGRYHSKSTWNASQVNDPELDAAIDAAKAASNYDEQRKYLKEVDQIVVNKFYNIWGPFLPFWQVHQPWVKGFGGEAGLGGISDACANL